MPPDDRLDSWKQIAAYLGREVRTVQLWEKSEGLPVHRHQHARQGTVYAFKPELDAWREARRAAPAPEILPAAPVPEPRLAEQLAEQQIEQPPAASPKRRRFVSLAAGAGLVVAAIIGGLFLFWPVRPQSQAVSAVVVLPFADFSSQHDLEYFADGLTEEIIDGLSRVPNLRVVARTSAFSFKGKPRDIRQIGKELNVDGVIEGSIQRSDDQIRITVQLNRVSDGTHLWSRKYDRPLHDTFAVQNDISQAIANELRAVTLPQRVATADPEAYRLYQEGRYFFNQFRAPESNLKAIDRYQQAIQHDPQFALAYAGISEAYAYLAENFVMSPAEVMPKAKEAAQKAVELDPDSAQTHTALAAVMLDYDWDREGAGRELEKALQLNPGSAWAHHWNGHALEAQNRYDDALKELRLSLSLDPLSIPLYWDVGSELIAAGRYDEALQHLSKAIELFPNVPNLLMERAVAFYSKGDLDQGRATVKTIQSLGAETAGDPLMINLLAMAAIREGRTDDAERIVDRFEEMRHTQFVDPSLVLPITSALGDTRKQAVWNARLQEEHSTLYFYLPLFDRFWSGMSKRKAR